MLLVLIPTCILSQVGCDKDDDHTTKPIDLLPPATQTGENTVGALVDGEAFLPKGGGLTSNKNCYYQFIGGGYHFLLRFSIFTGDSAQSIRVGTKNATIEEGGVYNLNAKPFYTESENGRGGGYSTIDATEEKYYYTTPSVTGELHITKLNFENHIVSGTFWFDAVNEEGEMVEVREGRFDMQFTQ